MKKGILICITILIVVIGALSSTVFLFRQRIMAQFDLEDAKRHYDSIWTEHPDDWKYTYVNVPEQQSYNARICAYKLRREDDGTQGSLDAALLRVTRFQDKKIPPSIEITLCFDSIANRNAWLRWDEGNPYPTVLQLTSDPITHTLDLSDFILDPYESVLDSIMHHDSLTMRVWTKHNDKVTIHFKLPPLDTVMLGNQKMIIYTEKDNVEPE